MTPDRFDEIYAAIRDKVKTANDWNVFNKGIASIRYEQTENERRVASERNKKRAKATQLRDAATTKWIDENLRVGMIVSMRGGSRTPLRYVTYVGHDMLQGLHLSEPRGKESPMRSAGYITSHVARNASKVLCCATSGQPITFHNPTTDPILFDASRHEFRDIKTFF